MQVTMDREQRRRARRRAAEQGLTLSDYVARLVADDLDAWSLDRPSPRVIPVEAELPSDHDRFYIGEAVAARMNKPPER